MFCPACGSAVKEEARFCPKCGAEIAPLETQPLPVSEARPKRRVRWPLFVLPILILALAAAGLFYWRATRTPTQIRYYNEAGELYSVDKFDRHGGYIENVGYENGEKTYTEEYRLTDAPEGIDPTAVEDMDGVAEVECRELFIRERGKDGFEPENAFFVIGYDRHGKLAGAQIYLVLDEDIFLIQTWELVRDRFGNPVEETVYAGNGDTRVTESLENTCRFGQIVSAEMRWKDYGTFHIDTETKTVVIEPYDEPITETRTVEYRY